MNILIPDEIARKHDKLMDNFINSWAKDRYPPASKVVNPRTPREIKAVRYMSDGSRCLFDAEMFVRYVKNGSLDRPPNLFVAYINDITEMKGTREFCDFRISTNSNFFSVKASAQRVQGYPTQVC